MRGGRSAVACVARGVSTVLVLGAVLVTAASAAAPYQPAKFAEPVVLSSKGGVLEVNLFARQGKATLDTVQGPAENFLLFAYELVRGTASNGKQKDANLYPGPTLHVEPGDTLIVHMANELADLTIPDFYDPAYVAKGQEIPLYPRQLTSAPFNLHTHGLHVSPRGNSDNVLLHIPAGYTNTYTYRIPEDHPQGVYWYHSHLHTVTTQQTYMGLAALLLIGRADGALPLVAKHKIPVRNMAIQYNSIVDRQGGQRVLVNPSWSMWVNTAKVPEPGALADGSYQPSLAPPSFPESPAGTRFVTVWWAGPLAIANNRGQFGLVPQNLQAFKSADGKSDVAANPSLPDHQRDVQFTVNGQFQPVLHAKPGQTEIWILSNISDLAYASVTLTETATGRHPPIAIVGEDGNPLSRVALPPTDDGTTLVIPPASRYAIAVTMPEQGGLVLEMPPAKGLKTISRPGVLYTSNGTEKPPAVLGTVEVEPSAMSYFDGFFVSPTQVLARVEPLEGRGVTTTFAAGQELGSPSPFVDLQNLTPDVRRELVISGGFLNEHANPQDPKSFVYAFASNTFPNVPLVQPRLGSTEEWTFINHNNDEHPIHVHVNEFQVMSNADPVRNIRTGVQPWVEDNVNVPAPLLEPDETVIEVGKTVLRSQFTDFTGPFVMHCHRLNHEDNGLMTMVNVIPTVSSYAVASRSSDGGDTTVQVFDGDGDRVLATVTPFAGWSGPLSVAMGDVDGDQVLDLIAGKGPGGVPEVTARSGAGPKPFERELLRFAAFEKSFPGGVSVAAAGIDGNPAADNVIVAAGPGMPSSVKVFSAALPKTIGEAPATFATFAPYPDSTAGTTVAAGLVDAGSGRFSIVTAPGPGGPGDVATFRFDLYRPNTGAAAWCAPKDPLPPGVPRRTATFRPFGADYTGGISLATGWLVGAYGGAQTIVAAQSDGPGLVKIYSTGSALDGEPEVYLRSPDTHDDTVTFKEIASFAPFAESTASGVRVATTSTVHGGDLLVSGLDGAAGNAPRVRKYGLERASADARTVAPKLLADVASPGGATPSWLGGG